LRKVATSKKVLNETPMNLQLGLRTLVLLTVVAASTVVLVNPELFGGASAATAPAIRSMLVIGHN
jgi:hypothetical protein